jgi:hypothetical protein
MIVENNNVKQFFEELLYSLVKKILNFCNFSKKWNGNVARIIFRHCEYEGCYALNKIRVLISSSGRANFFL